MTALAVTAALILGLLVGFLYGLYRALNDFGDLIDDGKAYRRMVAKSMQAHPAGRAR